jgi:hypothetical protein
MGATTTGFQQKGKCHSRRPSPPGKGKESFPSQFKGKNQVRGQGGGKNTSQNLADKSKSGKQSSGNGYFQNSKNNQFWAKGKGLKSQTEVGGELCKGKNTHNGKKTSNYENNRPTLLESRGETKKDNDNDRKGASGSYAQVVKEGCVHHRMKMPDELSFLECPPCKLEEDLSEDERRSKLKSSFAVAVQQSLQNRRLRKLRWMKNRFGLAVTHEFDELQSGSRFIHPTRTPLERSASDEKTEEFFINIRQQLIEFHHEGVEYLTDETDKLMNAVFSAIDAVEKSTQTDSCGIRWVCENRHTEAGHRVIAYQLIQRPKAAYTARIKDIVLLFAEKFTG